jgi:hypothetical protein
MAARSTKTTFHLADDVRVRLKALGVEQNRTVTELLAEGADLVLQRYQGAADGAEVERRARALRERLRHGLYEGPAAADTADDLVYGARPPPRRRTRR